MVEGSNDGIETSIRSFQNAFDAGYARLATFP